MTTLPPLTVVVPRGTEPLNINPSLGRTWKLTLNLVDEAGVAFDWSAYGATLRAKQRLHYTAFDLDLSDAGGSPAITGDRPSGNMVVTLTPSTTAAMTFDSSLYELEMTHGTTSYRLLAGIIAPLQSVAGSTPHG